MSNDKIMSQIITSLIITIAVGLFLKKTSEEFYIFFPIAHFLFSLLFRIYILREKN